MISKDDLILWRRLHRISDEITRYEQSVFVKTNVTHQQYKILLSIAIFEDINATSAKITDLGHMENRSFGCVSLITDRMVANGSIKKVRDKTDRRVIRLKITRKGRQILKDASKPTNRLVSEMFADYSKKEKEISTTIFNKILHNLGIDYRDDEEDADRVVNMLNRLNKQ
jgi:DNA-binding MarR family transcriptional regulator